MLALHDKLIHYEKSDKPVNYFFEAKQGSFWHWKRVYVLKDEQSHIHIVQLNIFERIYGNLVGFGIKNYFKSVFSDKKILGFIPNEELDLLVYNTSRSRILSKTGNSLSPLEKITEQIENEEWRGNRDINIKTSVPYLSGRFQRKEWWGRFAERIGSSGLNSLIDQAQIKPGIALDIGSGKSESAVYLLQKGWTVICLDYSKDALTAMENIANELNEQWLKTNQLMLVCSSVEDYNWPTQVDLVLASSSLPYFDPSKIKLLMQNIYQSLKSNGHFIGNFFSSKYVGNQMEVSREMGSWFVSDKDSVGYLLAGQGYEVVECKRGDEQNPLSILFIGKKMSQTN